MLKVPFRIVNLILLILIISFFPIAILSLSAKGVDLKLLLLKFQDRPLCKDCNIILISLDTLSANHLPCYGYTRNTAPNLCRFAQDNIMFTNSFANATFTLPSHVTMFTGLLPSVHKVNTVNYDRLADQIPFLPEILHNNGYETDFYMKQGDDFLPIDKVYYKGIDSIVNTNSITNPDFDLWKDGLRRLKENSSKGKKTFLFLHTYFVHSPYLIGNDKPMYTQKKFASIPVTNEALFSCSKTLAEYFIKAFKEDVESGYWGDKTEKYKTYLSEVNANINNLDTVCRIMNEINSISFNSRYYPQTVDTNDSEQVDYIKALYDQRIHQLDQLLASVFELFRTSDYQKNTIVIITADHGEEFMEHGYIRHETLYDSNLKVPLIMYIPGINRKKVNQLTQGADIMPTILNLVGIKNNYKLQGLSLVNEIFDDSFQEKYIVAERNDKKQKVIRDRQYKMFTEDLGKKLASFELYDVSLDPGETRNIIFKYPDVVNRLKKELEKILSN